MAVGPLQMSSVMATYRMLIQCPTAPVILLGIFGIFKGFGHNYHPRIKRNVIADSQVIVVQSKPPKCLLMNKQSNTKDLHNSNRKKGVNTNDNHSMVRDTDIPRKPN